MPPDNISTEQIEETSNSLPQKRAKRPPDDNLQQLKATSINAAKTDDHLTGAEHLISQQSTNSEDARNQQPLMNGTFKFILPSEEDYGLAPEKNLDPKSAGLKSSRTTGVWHKILEENHSAQIKKKSLLGHLVCSEETQKNSRKNSRIRHFPYSRIWGSQDRRSVQSFSFKICFRLWIKKGKGETSRYKDLMPFWRFWNLS